METRGQTQDGNEDGSGYGINISCKDWNGDGEGNGNKDRIGEDGGEAKKRKKTPKSCRRHAESRGDLGGNMKRHREERVGPVAANSDNLKNNKEAGE